MVKRKSRVSTLQESYLTASVANDPVMLDVLTSGRDLHSEVARAAWPDILGNLSDKEIKEQYHELRFQAKGIEFGIKLNNFVHLFGNIENKTLGELGKSPVIKDNTEPNTELTSCEGVTTNS